MGSMRKNAVRKRKQRAHAEKRKAQTEAMAAGKKDRLQGTGPGQRQPAWRL